MCVDMKRRVASGLYLIVTIYICVIDASMSYALHKNAVDLSPVSEIIKEVVEGDRNVLHFSSDEEVIYQPHVLKRFYERRGYKDAWAGTDNTFEHADAFVAAVEGSGSQGLIPEYYHLVKIKNMLSEMADGVYNPESVAGLDLLLTDAFLMLGCHISAGCVNPVTVEAEWHSGRNDLQMDVLLEDALNEGNIHESLKLLLPPHTEYTGLIENLERYRNIEINGGWPTLTYESLLKQGDRGERVARLKRRLHGSHDLMYVDNGAEYDEETEHAVIRFQRRHGITDDGIVGPETVRVLNVSLEERLKQIEVNLERMRWISRNLGHRYKMVNIADYNLSVVENNETVISMEVVVGKPFRNTPVFTDEISYIVVNPSWKIPESIVKNELLHKIKKSPYYLKEQGMRVLTGWADSSEEIDPETINWDEITAANFKYVLRQDPGPLNPLGRIKFMLPNRFNIYLHDTPSRTLFSKTSRAFSHGCVRIKYPVDLAEYLVKDDPDWSRKKVVDAIYDNKELRITLSRPIRVHILYMTAWVDKDGILNFRKDIYGRDERLYQALQKRPLAQLN
jgi:murein L,D-transpeptidase YcbB/YkuD